MPQQLERAPSPSPSAGSRWATREDFPTGEPKAIFYFDRHLVAGGTGPRSCTCRTRFCPHLGAHLGHGGTVDGCEIVCPFHGWKPDADGANTDIPYSERTNKKGTLLTYPVVERNGVSFAWYHPEADVAPMWDVPELAEFTGDPDWSARDPHLARDRRPGRRWPRTASTPPTSGTCTTRPRCRGDGELRDRLPGHADALSQKFPTPAA